MNKAYLAGFFDGEGCIDIQRERGNIKKRGYVCAHPRVRIAQVAASRYVLDEICKMYGGAVYYRTHKSPTQRDSVSFEGLQGKNLIRFMEDILPHLVVKREQVSLALWWMQNMAHKKRAQHPGIDKARLFFAEEMSAMKHDPQRLSERAIQVISELMLQSDHTGDRMTKAETTLARAA